MNLLHNNLLGKSLQIDLDSMEHLLTHFSHCCICLRKPTDKEANDLITRNRTALTSLTSCPPTLCTIWSNIKHIIHKRYHVMLPKIQFQCKMYSLTLFDISSFESPGPFLPLGDAFLGLNF